MTSALVTAGGTAEPLDDVRVLTNRSTGRFGAAIANALAAAGVEVTLLGSEGLFARRVELAGSIRQVRFESSAELAAALDEALAAHPDLVFMAAAVSDYAPQVTQGKISSSAEERSLVLRRTPKLLDRLRTACPDAYLVGFKLLSGASRDELQSVARGQIQRARLDLCVANDLQELGGSSHPVLLVEPHGSHRIEGPRQRVAERLVRHALAASGHPAGGWRELPAPAGLSGEIASGPALQLGAAQRLTSDEPLGPALARLAAQGPLKAPAAFVAAGRSVLLLSRVSELLIQIQDAEAAWRKAFEARLAPELGAPLCFRPLLEGTTLRGLLVEGSQGVALAEPLPSEGPPAWVEALLAHLAEEPCLWIPASAALLEARAFQPKPSRGEGELRSWSGPMLRDDLRAGASLCLFAPASRRVLLGRRTKAPADRHWAFPGGGRESGETAWETACRELQEEAGILCEARPAGHRHVFHGEAGRAYWVEGFVGLTLSEPDPVPNGELSELAWFDLEAALELAPITPGTRRVLLDLIAGRLPS